jgi:hypothetical protein
MDFLLGVVQGGMNISIFDSRYSDGLVVVMTVRTEHSAAIEDNFSGGDMDWSAVRFPLPTLGWFPIVFVEKIEEAIPEIQKKIKQIEAMNLDFRKWHTCVEWLGSLIESDKHFKLLYDIREDNDLCDIEKAYEILGNSFS